MAKKVLIILLICLILGGLLAAYYYFKTLTPNVPSERTGEHNVYQFQEIAPNSEVRLTNTLGALKLTLKNDSFNFEFKSIPGYEFTDKGLYVISWIND